MYIVKEEFADIRDNGYVYHKGDAYPRAGIEADEIRIRELASHTNRLGVPLIELAMPKPTQSKKRARKKAE